MPVTEPPEKYIAALQALAEISDNDFRRLWTELELVHDGETISDFANSARSIVAEDAADEMLPALLSMITHTEHQGVPLSEFAAGLAEAENMALAEASREQFVTRLTNLVVNGPVRVLHKSLDLAADFGSVFLDARILTDVRPVFDDDVGDRLQSAIIVHSLRIDSRQGNSNTVDYFAMDERDLLWLRQVIDRALSKEAASRRLLVDSGVLEAEKDVHDEPS